MAKARGLRAGRSVILGSLLLGYLLGSIPFGYLLGRLSGIDLRQEGSGNIGATNALRTLGVPAGLASLLLDVGKGLLAVYLGFRLGSGPWAPALAAMGAILGHAWSVFLGFTGGKVVATTAGILILLSPYSLAVALGVFLVTVLITRYVSLGSILAIATVALTAALLPEPLPYRLAALLAVAISLWRHRSNIHRLRLGTERRFGQKE